MSRLLFFLLLVAVLALGAHLWLTAGTPVADVSAREMNPQDVRVVSVTPPRVAARDAEEARRELQGLAGAACVEFSGIAPDDLARARAAFAALALGDRLVERPVEDVSRYWVFAPPARDRRAAEAAVAQMRRQGVSDLSIRPDNAISLGVFSSEDAGRRFLASVEAKGVKGAQLGPFAKELRDVTMLVREPDTETVARLAIMQRDFAGSRLRAVTCPAPDASAAPPQAAAAAPAAAPAR
ncbi:MAG TPA: hypothetical protein VEG27_10865 [Usitatibacter sp.]|nr:hypothetical protein [Usitatibacter sp.]